MSDGEGYLDNRARLACLSKLASGSMGGGHFLRPIVRARTCHEKRQRRRRRRPPRPLPCH